jgi:hypothetical protein
VGFQSVLFPKGSFTFSASVNVSVAPAVDPGAGDVVQFVSVSDPIVQVLGGISPVVNVLLGTMKSFISNTLVTQMQRAIPKQIPALVAAALALPALPDGVTLSLRKLQFNNSAVTFQPALGALGTVLSSFKPPVIPPA